MGKGKMNLLDVRAMVKELQSKLIGLRLANIYNLSSSKSFLFKFSATDQKQLLLVESGVRFHTTAYAREHDKLPSNFCAKLRKHLRLKRLESMNQIGLDRIVDLQFGTGAQAHHLILEFYAQGNIILTDANYRIIMLLRVHTYTTAGGKLNTIGAGAVMEDGDAPAPASLTRNDSEEVNAANNNINNAVPADDSEDRVAVHEQYPMSQAQQSPSHLSEAMISACIEKQVRKERSEYATWIAKLQAEEQKALAEAAATAASSNPADAAESSAAAADASSSPSEFRNAQGKKQRAKEDEKLQSHRKARELEDIKRKLVKPKMKQGVPLKAVLAQDLFFGPDVIEHCLMQAKIDPNQTLQNFLGEAYNNDNISAVLSSDLLKQLCASLQEAPALLERISKESMPGYIFWKVENQNAAPTAAPAQAQGEKKAADKKKKEKRNAKGELVVDEANVAPTAALVQDQNADSAAAPAQAPDATSPAKSTPSAASSSIPTNTVATSSADASKKDGVVIYTEYVPILLAAHSQRAEYRSMPAPLQFKSFDEAMDEFYSKAEEQKEELRLIKERQAALQKLEREKQRQQVQLQALEQQQQISIQKAELIEHNLEPVNAAIQSVNVEIAKGTDWRDLTRMIKQEKLNHNPVAKMIHSLKLLENQITVTLSEGMKHLMPDFNYKDKTVKVYQVDIDLSLSAFANAQNYYQMKKKHAEKQVRAESASQNAIRAAERKTTNALNSVDVRARIQKVRKVYWFEKYHFFISSENFLVIGGKDAQQNETLVKKHLGPNDIYVHAEVHGASSVIVKNHTNGAVPPLTLSQAGSMTICRSSAWKNKVLVEAYWVKADQVSKTPPTGLHLPTGSFMIRGKKNFLPRCPLVMGIGLLFRVDDSCRSKHIGERRIRTLAETEEAEQKSEDKFDQVGDLPSSTDLASGGNKSSSSKKKKHAESGGSSSSKKKKKPASEDALDFDVTSNLRPVSSAAVANIGKLTSEDENTDAEEEEKKKRLEAVKAPVAPAGKKKMSAAERKRLKKGGSSATTAAEAKEEEDEEEAAAAPEKPNVKSAPAPPVAADSDSDDDWGNQNKNKKKKGKKPAASPSTAAPAPAPAAPLPRGKRNKAKRAAARYADQDEEDLALAASLLGLQNVDQKKKEIAEREKKFKGKKDEEEESESEDEAAEESKEDGAAAAVATPVEDDSDKICFLCKTRGHVYKTCPQRTSQTDVSFAQAKKASEDAEAESIDAIKSEEGVLEEEESDAFLAQQAQHELELLALTGKPLFDDVSHFILPVCAPYDALQDYKYKLKLIPGTAKKGAAAKQSLFFFMNNFEKITPPEKELIKLVPDQDIINVLPSNIKLVAPQGEAGKGKQKKKPTGGKGGE